MTCCAFIVYSRNFKVSYEFLRILATKHRKLSAGCGTEDRDIISRAENAAAYSKDISPMWRAASGKELGHVWMDVDGVPPPQDGK